MARALGTAFDKTSIRKPGGTLIRSTGSAASAGRAVGGDQHGRAYAKDGPALQIARAGGEPYGGGTESAVKTRVGGRSFTGAPSGNSGVSTRFRAPARMVRRNPVAQFIRVSVCYGAGFPL